MDTSEWLRSFEATRAAADGWNPCETETLEALGRLRLDFLGRGGRLTESLKGLKGLSLDDRRKLGPRAQSLKASLAERIQRRKSELESSLDLSLEKDRVDVTLPALPPGRGRLHPLTLMALEMTDILRRMGFSVADGPLVEDDWHNFGALNIPEHHPARDMQDTFYLKDLPFLLRTHTSPVQIRAMERARPPLRVICPGGRVFRHDQVDATHSAVFHQVECLAVDRGITFADLKGTLDVFMKSLLGPSTKTRFRPSYFQFTEPSAEVDVSCLLCGGKGCPVCKLSGWLEMLGAGVVNPAVFKAVGLDPEEWSGFAFGLGVERLAIMKYRIPDIRLFYENDLRFLRQFDENIV
ncbi:MAG: phenylalanine--tRNA ligase subunit alpha [Elusimicrobia bacterium]|nr:phenylalanine--tRNA ligase subunit alpha [Elusimicrobiota bacterium]